MTHDEKRTALRIQAVKAEFVLLRGLERMIRRGARGHDNIVVAEYLGALDDVRSDMPEIDKSARGTTTQAPHTSGRTTFEDRARRFLDSLTDTDDDNERLAAEFAAVHHAAERALAELIIEVRPFVLPIHGEQSVYRASLLSKIDAILFMIAARQ